MRYILLLLICLVTATAVAQSFISSGKIMFEKKINLTRIYQEKGLTEFMKNQPQSNTTYFELSFSSNKTLYKPGRAGDPPVAGTAAGNIVFTDFNTGFVYAKKEVFESTYLVADSIAKITWKITPDTRMIAGVNCRKAVGVIMDSLVIIAFYTDRIPVSGGPESFVGLPGMIMGLAIPKMHTTWYASSVQQIDEKDAAMIKIPAAGKTLTRKELLTTLQKTLHGGRDDEHNIWQILI
ncbi:GLPGLI family protein [Chitinophaga niastensis]|uniref:GLPGLI family protein n=1 Tax=Chitinophaga niastensis TaxID=536980 RepID=A0A2P8HHI1_CHINA|nr:GLPGLI family protein [Chitinophaga niastensis]PSL45683.1 GLPGLI family protein [Chitinophaga niastensis]